MKNFVIVFLVVGLSVTGYIAATKSFKMSLESLEGKKEKIIRGDLTLPINATGQVRPARRVEIKSKASGEVIEVTRIPGDLVRAGDVIIRLQQDDEQRNVNRVKLDLITAAARLEETKLRLQLAEGPDLDSANAKVQQFRESIRLHKYRLDKVRALPSEQTNEEELLQREVAYNRELLNLADAQANRGRAELAIPLAQQAVTQAEAAHARIIDNLADAEKLLRETEIIAPINGIVGSIAVDVGDVIQGGKTTFTGGTVLATVLDMSRIVVEAEVDESDIERVRAIAPAWAIPHRDPSVRMPDDLDRLAAGMDHLPVITVESFRNDEFIGVIALINPEPSDRAGVVAYIVDVVVASANRKLLLPGMRADVRFTSEHRENVVLCPNEAIREGKNGGLGVYVPKTGAAPQEHETDFLECRFGLSNGNYSEVLCEELEPGMAVYTKLPVNTDKDS